MAGSRLVQVDKTVKVSWPSQELPWLGPAETATWCRTFRLPSRSRRRADRVVPLSGKHDPGVCPGLCRPPAMPGVVTLLPSWANPTPLAGFASRSWEVPQQNPSSAHICKHSSSDQNCSTARVKAGVWAVDQPGWKFWHVPTWESSGAFTWAPFSFPTTVLCFVALAWCSAFPKCDLELLAQLLHCSCL